MTQSERSRIVLMTAVGAVTTIGLLAGAGDAHAARRKKKQIKVAEVRAVQTPLGLQGTRGAGNNVVTPFALVDKSRRKSDVQAEYGYDVNGDGVIADGSDPNLPSEFFPATEDRRDARNTRKNKKPQLFTTAGGIGSAHAFVWNSSADIQNGHYPTVQIRHTPQGRPVPDPNNPGSYLFEAAQAGVKLRVRPVAKNGSAVGEWAYTDAFALNNNTPPSMTIDDVVPNTTSTPTASDEVVEIRWTAYDEDSEDKNGNGVLDPLDLEDVNGNGRLDAELVAVAFDYWRVPDGVDPTTFTPEQLEALLWQPCTRAEGVGDTDAGVPSAPPGVGRQNTFAWNSLVDVGTVKARFILRAKPFDEKSESGATVYLQNSFELDNHTVFNQPNTAADLPSGRVGTASVNLVPGLARSDPAYEPPLQSFLQTGGATVADGPGTTFLAVSIVNTETAETTTASAVPFTQLTDARSYHTATLLDDGRVLLAGGFNASGSPLSTTEIYDPATHTMSPGPALLTARAKHAAVRLANGDVMLVGGVGASGQPLASAEVHNFTPFGAALEANTALPAIAVAQHSLHAVLLPDQKVLVAGGVGAGGTAVTTAQCLDTLRNADADPTTKEPDWITVGSMNEARKFATATPLTQGHVLFAGGAASPAKATLEVYNWQTSMFESVSVTMPDGGRAQHVAALLGNGRVLLAGGTTDPDVAGSALVAAADVFELGARNDAAGTWDGTFHNTNGDMVYPRREAEALTINNGRVFIIGGLNATGGALAEVEIYTPRGGLNLRPAARTDLESKQQSWAFGAPIVYRTTDPEQDDVRVIVQWSNDGGLTWNAAASQATTIGGDVAEATAPLSTGPEDDETKGIAPRVYPESDHKYIWAMTRDIPRPPPGSSTGPYIFRTLPFGAVQGASAQSVPVTVLYNTKVIPTILPMENRIGEVGPEQGGDIYVWVHLRDIDGDGAFSNGDDAEALFEYAIDTNGDGIINDGAEFWVPMSRSGAAKYADRRQDNRQTGLLTYSESYLDSGTPGPDGYPLIADRDPNLGWTVFEWDSVFDLGAPATSRDDVFIRVRPFDNLAAAEPDEGFTAIQFNETGQDPSFILVRDPDGLWLDRFEPAGGNAQAVAVEEPLEFHFNGLVDPATVNDQTIQIRIGSTPILGVFTVQQDVPNFTTLVTFFPRPNSTVNDQLVYSEQSNPTVLFPLNTYSIFLPGYHAGDDYPSTTATVLPDLGGTTPDETSHLVLNVEINTSFRTSTGNYDDGQPNSVTLVSPVDGQTVAPDAGMILSYAKGVDIDTVEWPNLTVTVDNTGGGTAATAGRPVIPYQRSITNTQDPVTGLVTSTVQIVPLLHLPSGRTVNVQTTSGLLGANGRPVEASLLTYTVQSYGQKTVSARESFGSTTNEDTTVQNRASWGADPCAPGTLTGLQGAGTPPQGGSNLYVADGQVHTITNTVNDYNNITVEKGGTLRIRAAGAVTIRATGDITIAGKVDFRGDDGWTATNGNTSGYYYYTNHTSPGTRQGGTGYNGGGSGGQSRQTTRARQAGSNGTGSSYGGGGLVAGNSTYYYYGAGGGAGAGHGAPGLPGGMASAYSSAWTRMGNVSTPGGTHGDPDMISGPSAAGGGGGGGSSHYSSNWYHGGGGGGAGGGALTIVCNGTFDLRPSGYIDGRGGNGGSSSHYGGSGGGGAGGGCKIVAGTAANLDGVVDLRGGKGGYKGTGYFSDYYNRYQTSYGTSRFGGDGGPGRFVVAAPNFVDYDEVRVKGQLMVQQISTVPTTTLTPQAPPSDFANGGTINYGSTTQVRYTSLTVPAGRTVNIQGTNALRIYADNIDIQGTLRINGNYPTYGFTTSRTGGVLGSAPTGDYYYVRASTAQPPTQYVGGVGTLGGGNGGNGITIGGTPSTTNNYRSTGTDGAGPAAGLNVDKTNGGWNTGSQHYKTGDVGGGGGGNATPGDNGWAPYCQGARYNYTGAASDNTNGRSPTNVNNDSNNGGGVLDATSITVATLANFVASGGGGGNAGFMRYPNCSWNYFGMAGGAGSGAGALALIGADTVTVDGTIQAIGGDGNISGAPYYSRGYQHSGGGGGSGGTVMLVADRVNIGAVTNINSSSSGATFELQGGIGGGYRQQYRNSSTITRYPTYNSEGNFGGEGGFGRLVVQYRSELNNGKTLFNRGGMEFVAFDDISRRYTVLSGSARAKCLGGNDGGNYRSKWIDLQSVSPVVTTLAASTVGTNTTYTLQGEGAQSDPHDPGAGTGVPDPNNTSGMQNPSSNFLNGWRFFRFGGTISRSSTDPTRPPPVVDDVDYPHVTDDI